MLTKAIDRPQTTQNDNPGIVPPWLEHPIRTLPTHPLTASVIPTAFIPDDQYRPPDDFKADTMLVTETMARDALKNFTAKIPAHSQPEYRRHGIVGDTVRVEYQTTHGRKQVHFPISYFTNRYGDDD